MATIPPPPEDIGVAEAFEDVFVDLNNILGDKPVRVKRMYYVPALGEMGLTEDGYFTDGKSELRIPMPDGTVHEEEVIDNPHRIYILEAPGQRLPAVARGGPDRRLYWMVVTPSWEQTARRWRNYTISAANPAKGDALRYLTRGVRLDDLGNPIRPTGDEIAEVMEEMVEGFKTIARTIGPFRQEYLTDDDLLALHDRIMSFRSLDAFAETFGEVGDDDALRAKAINRFSETTTSPFDFLEDFDAYLLPAKREIELPDGRTTHIYIPTKPAEAIVRAHGNYEHAMDKLQGVYGKRLAASWADFEMLGEDNEVVKGLDITAEDIPESRYMEEPKLLAPKRKQPTPPEFTSGGELHTIKRRGKETFLEDPHLPRYMPKGSAPERKTFTRGDHIVTLLSGNKTGERIPVAITNEGEIIPVDSDAQAAFLNEKDIQFTRPDQFSDNEFEAAARAGDRKDLYDFDPDDPTKSKSLIYYQNRTRGTPITTARPSDIKGVGLPQGLKPGTIVRHKDNPRVLGKVRKVYLANDVVTGVDPETDLPVVRKLPDKAIHVNKDRIITGDEVAIDWDASLLRSYKAGREERAAKRGASATDMQEILPEFYESERVPVEDLEVVERSPQAKEGSFGYATGPKAVLQSANLVKFHRKGPSNIPAEVAKYRRMLGVTVRVKKVKGSQGDYVLSIADNKRDPWEGEPRPREEWDEVLKKLGYSPPEKPGGMYILPKKPTQRAALAQSEEVVLQRVEGTNQYRVLRPHLSEFKDTKPLTLSEWYDLLNERGYNYSGPIPTGGGAAPGTYDEAQEILKERDFKEVPPGKSIVTSPPEPYTGRKRLTAPFIKEQGASGPYRDFDEPYRPLDPAEQPPRAQPAGTVPSYTPLEDKKNPTGTGARRYFQMKRALEDALPANAKPLRYMVPDMKRLRETEELDPAGWYMVMDLPKNRVDSQGRPMPFHIPTVKNHDQPDRPGYTDAKATTILPEGKYVIQITEALPGGQYRYRIIGAAGKSGKTPPPPVEPPEGSPEEEMKAYRAARKQWDADYGHRAHLPTGEIWGSSEHLPVMTDFEGSDLEDWEPYVLKKEFPEVQGRTQFHGIPNVGKGGRVSGSRPTIEPRFPHQDSLVVVWETTKKVPKKKAVLEPSGPSLKEASDWQLEDLQQRLLASPAHRESPLMRQVEQERKARARNVGGATSLPRSVDWPDNLEYRNVLSAPMGRPRIDSRTIRTNLTTPPRPEGGMQVGSPEWEAWMAERDRRRAVPSPKQGIFISHMKDVDRDDYITKSRSTAPPATFGIPEISAERMAPAISTRAGASFRNGRPAPIDVPASDIPGYRRTPAASVAAPQSETPARYSSPIEQPAQGILRSHGKEIRSIPSRTFDYKPGHDPIWPEGRHEGPFAARETGIVPRGPSEGWHGPKLPPQVDPEEFEEVPAYIYTRLEPGYTGVDASGKPVGGLRMIVVDDNIDDPVLDPEHLPEDIYRRYKPLSAEEANIPGQVAVPLQGKQRVRRTVKGNLLEHLPEIQHEGRMVNPWPEDLRAGAVREVFEGLRSRRTAPRGYVPPNLASLMAALFGVGSAAAGYTAPLYHSRQHSRREF